ncbi:MAG: nucleoside triphosphate pyrophosphatase [Pseudomonadota bacterium]
MSFKSGLIEQRVYLASRSPRRRALLEQMGVPFQLLPFRDVSRDALAPDELPQPGELPQDYVLRVSCAKAAHAQRAIAWRKLPSLPVLTADTTLDLDGEIIGKPRDEADAKAILRRLSGRQHRVLTALTLDFKGQLETALSVNELRFAEWTEAAIERYVASGEPMDKAGAYAIQGRAGMLIEHLSGSYTGVMGLPFFETAQLLTRIGFVL